MVKASLHIDDLNFNVLEFEHTISKQVDHEGYPTSKAGFRGLNLIIELSSDNTFWEYAIADNLPLPKVVLKISPAVLGQSQTRYMYLYDCHVVYQKTKFTAYSNEAAYQHVTITCQGLEFSFSKAIYQTLWRKTFPNEAATPTVREEDAPKLIRYYITDLSGNELNSYEDIDKIILHLETENSIGENLTVKIPDKTYDFKHNGIHLQNDTLKDYRINSDIEEVELEVIEQES